MSKRKSGVDNQGEKTKTNKKLKQNKKGSVVEFETKVVDDVKKRNLTIHKRLHARLDDMVLDNHVQLYLQNINLVHQIV